MNRKSLILAACLFFGAIVLLVLSAAKGGQKSFAQKRDGWKLVVTLPKTNSNPVSTNELLRGTVR
jgi:hypothetical protein